MSNVIELSKQHPVTAVPLTPTADAYLEACFVGYEAARRALEKDWVAQGKPQGYRPPPELTRDQIKAQCLESGLSMMLNSLTAGRPVHGHGHRQMHPCTPLGDY